jgi:hypothetical protein
VRRLGWIGGVVGGLVALRWLRRGPRVAAEPVPEPTPAEDPGEELRAKLAESRTAEPAPEVDETPPEPVAEEEPAAEPESPEDRRRQVHEEGRAALDEMKSDHEGSAGGGLRS